MTSDTDRSIPTVTLVRAGVCLLIIACGLALRRFGLGLGLPVVIVKYGGSILWAMMVFFLVALMASRLPRPHIALIAASMALGVELFRLIHTPELDAFRLTTIGALLLGRVFSLWNLLAYGVGIIAGVAVDRVGVAAIAKACSKTSPRSYSAS